MLEFIRSVVRPVVTIALTATAIYGFVVGLIDPKAFLLIFGIVIGFWFNERAKAGEPTQKYVIDVTEKEKK